MKVQKAGFSICALQVYGIPIQVFSNNGEQWIFYESYFEINCWNGVRQIRYRLLGVEFEY